MMRKSQRSQNWRRSQSSKAEKRSQMYLLRKVMCVSACACSLKAYYERNICAIEEIPYNNYLPNCRSMCLYVTVLAYFT